MFRCSLLIVLFCFAQPLYSQDSIENAMMSFQEIVEEIVMQTDDETAADDLAEKLSNLAENPVRVNMASLDELNTLFWISDFQIKNLKDYILQNGLISSIFEIPYISGFSEKDAKLLAPFISFETQKNSAKVTSKRILDYGKHRFLLRSNRVLEKQEGYGGNFEGGAQSLYCRYSFQYENRILAGFTAEKDAGEQLFAGSNKNGFDFHSYFVQINSQKLIKNIVLGDYRVNFGQGMVVGNGFNLGKSVSSMGSLQRSTGISRYQGSDENRFFRGAAITFNLKPVETSVWVSAHAVDANKTKQDSLTGQLQEVSSLLNTGIHALQSEINDEDAVMTKVGGANVTFCKPFLVAGITAMNYTYSTNLNPEPEPYNQFYFRGNSNYNLGADYRCRIKNLVLFGEGAVSRNGGKALLNGAQVYISSKLSFSLINRYYQRNYQAMYGNAFGENSRNANEEGLYAGLETHVLRYVSLSAFIDVFRFPWMTYTSNFASTGRDFFLQATIATTGKMKVSVQYRNKRKTENYSEAQSHVYRLDETSQERLGCSFLYNMTDLVSFKTRLDLTAKSSQFALESRGFLISQDADFGLAKFPFRFYIRYALFDTDDYNSRLYTYEHDLLYTFNIPAMYDKGYRTYLMCKFSPDKRIDLWLKYSYTGYAERNTVGSGYYEIDGSHKSEIKMQLLLKL